MIFIIRMVQSRPRGECRAIAFRRSAKQRSQASSPASVVQALMISCQSRPRGECLESRRLACVGCAGVGIFCQSRPRGECLAIAFRRSAKQRKQASSPASVVQALVITVA